MRMTAKTQSSDRLRLILQLGERKRKKKKKKKKVCGSSAAEDS